MDKQIQNGAANSAHKVIDSAAAFSAEHIAATAHNTVDKLAGYATQASNALCEKGDQISEASARVTESARGQVRNKPLAAVGIALAAGVVLGWLLKKN